MRYEVILDTPEDLIKSMQQRYGVRLENLTNVRRELSKIVSNAHEYYAKKVKNGVDINSQRAFIVHRRALVEIHCMDALLAQYRGRKDIKLLNLESAKVYFEEAKELKDALNI
jgi:hypothetical protein